MSTCRMNITTPILLLCLLITTAAAERAKNVVEPVPNFLSTRFLADGELERRVHISGITAKETAVVLPAGVGNSKQGVRVWQVTDGRHFLQVIYDVDFEMRDCEYVRDPESVRKFLSGFEPDIELTRRLSPDQNQTVIQDDPEIYHNASIMLLGADSVDTLPVYLKRLVDYKRARKDCKVLHKQIKAYARQQKKQAEQLEQLNNEQDKEFEADTQDNTNKDITRLKRNVFIYPGTNWCGVGSTTDGKYNELGWNAAADRCCRRHDHCPHTIVGFTTKYNLFNYRFHTISHCECDERFRTCLKMVNNQAANMLGKVFFNVAQMKCFTFKPDRACVKRTWWGRCLQEEKQKTAVIREPLTY